MQKFTGFEDIDEHSRWLVRHKAEQLVGHYGFTESDVEDIEQELIIHLLLRLRSYDPSRGARTTFVESVVKNKLRNIIKDERQSGSYDYRLIGKSLDECVAGDGEDGLVFGDVLSSDAISFSSGRSKRTAAEQSELRVDMNRALSAMTSEMRELCAKLADSNIADIARETGLPRHKIQWLRTRIKRVFVRFRLDEYR